MRKYIIIVLVLSIAIPSIAQEKNKKELFFFITNLGVGLPMNHSSSSSFTWQVLSYYNITKKLSVGTGTGLLYYDKIFIPLYGNARFQTGNTGRFTPFAELITGYSFATAKNANGGFYMNPSFGIQYPLRNKAKLQLAIGYELQNTERLKKQADNYLVKEFVEKQSNQSISFKLGFIF